MRPKYEELIETKYGTYRVKLGWFALIKFITEELDKRKYTSKELVEKMLENAGKCSNTLT